MAESVQSNRGKRKIVHENHLYTFTKRSKSEEHCIWVCEKRSICRGRMWTRADTDEVVREVTPHTHAAQAARPEAVRIINNVCQEQVQLCVEQL